MLPLLCLFPHNAPIQNEREALDPGTHTRPRFKPAMNLVLALMLQDGGITKYEMTNGVSSTVGQILEMLGIMLRPMRQDTSRSSTRSLAAMASSSTHSWTC